VHYFNVEAETLSSHFEKMSTCKTLLKKTSLELFVEKTNLVLLELLFRYTIFVCFVKDIPYVLCLIFTKLYRNLKRHKHLCCLSSFEFSKHLHRFMEPKHHPPQ
jgi:hypothetical protein